MLPEVDGELNLQGLMFGEPEAVWSQLRRYRRILGIVKEMMNGTLWNMPVVKIRARGQMEDLGWCA